VNPPPGVLTRDAVRLGVTAGSREDAVRMAGRVLVESGAAEPGYEEAMVERERSISTSIGEGFAIPHGTDDSRVLVRRTGLSFVQFPAGVDWADDTVFVCIGIAARDDAHLDILARLAETIMEPELAGRLRDATDPDTVMAVLAPAFDQPLAAAVEVDPVHHS
jgi:PTS system mannitol-specific IIA component